MPLYSLYIPKQYGTLSLLPTVISDFLTSNINNSRQFEVVISPGYLGEGETFISKVTNILAGHVSSLTIYRGMTANQRHDRSTNDFQISLGVDVSPTPAGDDHRKMIFFRYGNNTEAVWVDSSNFSTTHISSPVKEKQIYFCFITKSSKMLVMITS